MTNADLMQRDLKVLWHPCTQMKDHERLPIVPIKKGQGVYLEDFDGNRYIDAVSSWWVNLFGHSHPRINRALRDQAERLEHVILAGFSHQPVIELSEKLVAITPEKLDRCFYADNGSSAVEVAIKMSFHYWRNRGDFNKKKLINLSNSYHGETLGALGAGDVALYKKTYADLLMEPITVPSPDCYQREPGKNWQQHSEEMFQQMEKALERHAGEVFAVIVEPLLQAAGSMRMYHPIYLTMLREACDRHGVHLIADEIATGFGRTGSLFACEQAGISPDFMCLSKGLTAGYLPLAVVLTTDEVYQGFYDEYENLTAFLHSHSYTGNALGCSVALETLAIFRDEGVIENNRQLANKMTSATAGFMDHPNIAEVRQTGMVLAIEMVQDKASKKPFDWKERRGLEVYKYALNKGALLRPIGDVVYFMPPYVISDAEIDKLAEIAWDGICKATGVSP